MSADVEFDIRGVPEVKAMLGQVSDRELANRTRRALRSSAAVFRKAMRSKRSGSWARRPKTFHKTRTRAHRLPLGVSVSPQSPLSTIFERGARPHGIPILVGRNAGRVVSHPGVRARPFVVPIFEAEQAAAEKAFRDELLKGLD